MKKKPKQQRNFVAKVMRALFKPTVLTDEKKENKLRPKKYKHSEEEE